MSTKTTFKRIALVAVASLGFGMLSVVPSNAAAPSITGVSSTSAASLDATFGTVSNTTNTAAFVTDITLPLTAIGRAIYTAADGYIGTVATVTTLGGTFTAVTTTTTLATVVAYLGTLPTITTSNGVTVGIINGMTVTAGKTVGINVRYAAGTPAATEKTRAVYAGIGVAGTSGASVTNVWLPSDAPPKMIPSPFRVTGISILLTR
jgi:hypothetical protein